MASDDPAWRWYTCSIEPSPPLPLDAYERRADWLAALLVAMVVVPGFADGLATPPPQRAAKPAARTGPRRSTGMARGGPVRPPRAC